MNRREFMISAGSLVAAGTIGITATKAPRVVHPLDLVTNKYHTDLPKPCWIVSSAPTVEKAWLRHQGLLASFILHRLWKKASTSMKLRFSNCGVVGKVLVDLDMKFTLLMNELSIERRDRSEVCYVVSGLYSLAIPENSVSLRP